jgi:ubiquinone biosynthesis protein
VFNKHSIRLKMTLEDLGIVFIKLGQSLSLKSFLFNKETLEILSYLQDSVTPSKLDVLKYLEQNQPNILQNNTFQIDEKPIACASIAQVYCGMIDGQKIAIKILKPNIQKHIHRDFAIIKFLGKIISKFLSPAFQLNDIIQNVYENILVETNFTIEAQNLGIIRKNIIFDAGISVPKVFRGYSGTNVLVMSFEEGISVKKIIHSNLQYDRRKIAENVIYTYLNQVYRDGIFHADMHSGNILIKEDLSIVLLDFGLISKIDNIDRISVATMIYAFASQNIDLILKTQLKAGYISRDVFLNYSYRIAMQKLAGSFVNSTGFQMSDFSRELFIVMEKFNVLVPKKLLLLNKTMIYIEDISKQLDPSLNPLSIINPWIGRWYKRERVKNLFANIKNFFEAIFE